MPMTCDCRAGMSIIGGFSIQSTMTYAPMSDARRNRALRRLERSCDFPIPS
jgi:hypothetical protein